MALTNKFGQLILNQTINHAGGSAAESIELSKALAAGIYQLTLNGAGLKIIKQVIKD
ncbi:MAG: hypothetical protein ABJA57_13290 [Ginsengibacter sp.]